MKKQLSGLLAAAMAVTSMGFVPITVSAVDKAATAEVSYNYDGQDHTRQMEKLDRGLVAVKTGDGVFLSWRLNGDEASVGDIAGAPGFKVYKNGTLIATVDNSTNYLDKSGTVSDSYTVAPEGGEQCGAVTPMDNSYFDIKLDKPADFAVDEETSYSYTAGDASCGDLDGDGEYEIVIKWDANPQDNSIAGITGNVYLDAYKLDGTRLWRIDLGRNIRGGAHYTQFLVYDFDLDGKAEITCKTAPGSLDGKSEYVSAASSDSTIQSADNSVSYVNDGGYIIEGPEYFTIFDGETGAAIDTINYPVQRVSASVWGDSYGNRCDRFVADVSYMDGEKPYAVYWRGYYFGQSGYGERTGVFAASFDGERLSVPENHIFDTRSDQPGYRSGNEIYVGEGNHNMTTADVDDDGRDEVISGALCLEFDDNDILSPKWCTFKEHGDALHIGDYDPTHQGLEFFTIHEDGGGVNIYGGVTLDFGASVIDPATGEIMKHWSGSKDTGRGLMANVGAGGYYQITAAAGINGWYCLGGGNFESGASIGQNFRVFWDGDLYDETLDGTTISAWNGSGMSGIFTADGCVSINGTKATPSLQADLFGDWREEVAYPLTDSSALRIFTTTDITEYKLPTLMHDPVYRSGVASEQSAYNQPPHIGFYLADEIFRPAVDYIEITKAPDKTEYTIGESLDLTGLEVTAHFTDGSSDIVTNYVVTGYNPDTDSEQTITVTYGKKTTEFTVRVNSGFTIDDNGYITGYTPDNESAVVPAVINGIPVKGFADGALTGSSLKSITISADETEIGNNVFPEGITIICYIGSDAYTYAVEHGIAYEIVETREFSANVTYSESGYSGWSMVQGGTAQTYQVGHITYGVPGRTNRGQPGGDGVSGFFTQDIGGDAVLNCSVGRFSTNNRNAYFTLTDIPMASDTMDSVFETDIMFINNSGKAAQMTVKDSNGAVIESVSAETLSAEYDTWYTYKLIYHNGRYYRSFCEKGGEGDIALIAELVSDYGMSRFDFTAAAGTTLGNGESANICLDNTKVYMNVEIAKLVLNVTDEDGNPIVSPKITINGAEYSGNRSGVCSAELFAGVYDVSVCADGYEDKRLTVSVYKSSVEKTIALSKTFVPLEGIAFEKETLALKEGQSGKVTAVTVPADATEQEIVYSSSDESVAAVDADGNVTAAAPGTAVITAASAADEAITAECTVTVYAGNYESVVTSIEIAAPEKAYISNTAVANEVRLTAQAYDQNGVAMEAEFSWLANVSGVTVNNGVLSIPATVKPGRCAVMAKSGGVSSKIAYIELVSITDGVDIIAEETLEEELNIVQGTSDTVQTIGDITYHSGARSGGGEAATGFYIGAFDNRQCLRAKAGRWASAEREAYFVFDKVTADSVYESGRDYVFETDIYFDGTEKLTFNSYSDGYGTALMQVDAGILGLEQKTWYHYILIYSEGKYSQYVIDGNGSFVSVPEPVVTGGSMIAQVHFLQGDESAASIYLAGTRYYTTDYATSDITVRVTDGVNAIPGASVTVAGIEAKTGENGAAVFTLPIGIYNISAVYGSVSGSAKAVSAGENVTYTIMLETADEPPVPSEPPAPEISAIDSVAGSVITVTAAESGLKLYAAKYDGGALARINVFDASVGTAEFAAEFEPDKVFLWDGDMKPIDIWIK